MGTGEEALATTVDQNTWTDTSTQIGEQYTYRVQSLMKAGENREAESDLSAPVEIVPKDIFPPAMPAGLRALPSTNSIELSWDRNTEPDLAGYRVYRAEPGGTFTKIAETMLPAYSDHDVQPGKHYQYQVSAFDSAGNESPRSAPVDAILE
jgi:hypothetical protein